MAEWGKRIRRAWDALRGEEFEIGSPAANAILSKLRGGGLSKLWRWATGPLKSADREIRGSLRGLRSKARELTWTWGYGSRWIRLLVENVVGDTGFQLQSKVEGSDGKEDLDVTQKIEKAWKRWGKVGTCTADGRLSWHGVEKLLIRQWGAEGEALLRLYPGFDNDWGFAVEVLDPDQLDDELNQPRTPDQNEIRMGVEVDRWNRPVAYHLWRRHPGRGITGYRDAGADERIRVPASQIIHLYEPWRAAQTRGLPFLTPVLFDSHLLSGLEEAELTSSRIAAAKMGILETDPEFNLDPEAITAAMLGEETELEIEVNPGGFTKIPAGYKLNKWDPQHPSSSFGEFHKSILRAIASGAHTGYNALANDLSDVNYTSLRQASLIERVTYRMVQRWAWEHVHDRVFEAWLPQALLTGQLDLPGFRSEPYLAHAWRPRGWEWVDPVKEVQADVIAVRAGFTSRTEVVGRRGGDLEQVFKQLVKEAELAEELGLVLDTSLEDAPSPDGPSDPDDGSGANGGGRSSHGGGGNTSGRSSAPPRAKGPLEVARDQGMRDLLAAALADYDPPTPNGGSDGSD